ncbi:hypothetical protein ACHAPO_007349 [Fusarium lateritium]
MTIRPRDFHQAKRSPKGKGKYRAVATDAAQVERAKQLAKWHHNFISVKRIFNSNNQHPDLTWPAWFDKKNDYSFVSHESPPVSEVKAGKQAKNHEKLGYPDGVLINCVFKSTMGANNELAAYLSFKGVLEMNSYIDVIVAGIIHQSALVTFKGYSERHA